MLVLSARNLWIVNQLPSLLNLSRILPSYYDRSSDHSEEELQPEQYRGLD